MKNHFFITIILSAFCSLNAISQDYKDTIYDINEYLFLKGYEIRDIYPLEGFCKNSKQETEMYRTGKWVYFYKGVGTAVQGEYHRDNEIGEWKAYYPSGALYYKGSYKERKTIAGLDCPDGVKYESYVTGEWIIYNEEGDSVTRFDFDADGKYLGRKTLATVHQTKFAYGDGNTGEGEGVLSSLEFIIQGTSVKLDHVKSIEQMGSFVRTGVWKAFNAEGILLSETTYDENTNEPSGLCKFYYKNGKLKAQGNEKGQLYQGEWSYYNENGVLESVKNYTDSQLFGKYTSYYENRKVKVETYYSAGVLNGTYNRYFSDGSLDCQGKYVDGKKNDLWIYYYANGKKRTEMTYKMDVIIGTCTGYHLNGNIQLEDSYNDNGDYLGPKACYDENGVQILKDGVGVYIKLYDKGTVSTKFNYKNGCREGMGTWYYENGQIDTEMLYKYDESTKPTGLRWEIVSSYKKDGSPREKGTLKNGNGSVINYDSDGAMTGTTFYENGIKK